MRKTSACFLALALLLTAAPTAGQAAAQKGNKRCMADSACLWLKTGYGFKRKVVTTNKIVNLSGDFNNAVSSLKNKTGSFLVLYGGKDAQGEVKCVPGGIKVPDLGSVEWQFNNEASSVRIFKNGENVPCAF